MKLQLLQLKDKVISTLNTISTTTELNDLKVTILGKKGEITLLMKEMGKMSQEERMEFGKEANEVKSFLQEEFDKKQNELKEKEKQKRIESETLDITLPGKDVKVGSLHPITIVSREMKNICREMGFDILDGPEVEETYYNFDALNIPDTHPSRDLRDTFYIDEKTVLRTHTSPMQVRYMKEHKPPFRMISVGKVYRSDYDMTHTPMFHQMEGLMIGEDVSFSDFKGLLTNVIKKLFGENRKVRFRPHFFPFTEPSAEMDVECGMCGGKGCRSCKGTGWLEILGSGMVDSNVLKEVGIDHKKYQGFAFGMGIERITMLKYGIDDLRSFFDNDVRFLEQFK